jgi:hypothetical protein
MSLVVVSRSLLFASLCTVTNRDVSYSCEREAADLYPHSLLRDTLDTLDTYNRQNRQIKQNQGRKCKLSSSHHVTSYVESNPDKEVVPLETGEETDSF